MNKILILFLFCKIVSLVWAKHVSDSTQEYLKKDNLVKNTYYLITTPKVWMSTEESVCLVLLKELSLPNAVINVKISSMNSREVFAQKYQPLNTMSECIQMPIKEIRAERALVRVQMADIIDETVEIRVRPSNGLTLIETSKPVYRPNERLQFRIITLNDWLRPIEEQIAVISVQNSKSMPVMQWTDIKVSNGMIALEMPIAEDNYYGIWKIIVSTDRRIVSEKIFKVIDYESPNIEISIDSPNYVYSGDKEAVNRVCVRNSFGQFMKGKLKIFVSYFRFNWERIDMLANITAPYDLSEVEINGCYDLVVMQSKLDWNSTKYSEQNLKLSFQFIDEMNGFIEEKVYEIPVVAQRLIISFPSVTLMKQYFKPDLPYFGHVMVVRPDYSPAPEERLTVCYQNRDIPWVSQSDYLCEQMVSNSDGLVEFTIPPMSNKLKQIEIKVQSTRYPLIETKMVLEPTYSPTDEYMTVRPFINNNHCNDSVEFDVLFNKPIDNQNNQIYYQVIGRGGTQAPQVYTLEESEQWFGQNMINTNTNQNSEVFVSKMRINLPKHSALNNNLINRILVYYMDSHNNLIADSNVFLTTCSDQSHHLTQISYETGNHGNGIDLRLKTRHNSTCSLRVTQNKPYNSLKKINQFIEKFNIKQESSVGDKCEKLYKTKKTESEQFYSPYTAPYGFDSMSSSYEPVINYGDAWDSFNDIGLMVTSNAKLDESPCDWDLYPRDTLSQLSQIRVNQMKLLAKNRFKKIVVNQIQDIERSLFNEVFDWNLVNTDSNAIDRHISHDLVSTSSQLYADSVCVNTDIGLTYTRNVFDTNSLNRMNDKQFRISVMAPKESRIGDTLLYKVVIEKLSNQRNNCFPIQLEFESSEFYEMIDRPKIGCICGNSSQPIAMTLKPKSVGLIDVKIIAKYPIDMIGSDCVQTDLIRFAPQIVSRKLSVNPIGIVSKQVNQQIVCRNNPNTVSEPEMQDLSDLRDSSDMIVTNELMEPMLRYIHSKVSVNNHNALDSLSAFAASYYLYNYSNNRSDNWVQTNKLMPELTKAFQSLMTYRHSDGSYSVIKSSKHKSDIGLTASVFKVLAQSKPYLGFIENGNRINRLHHTLIWIYEQQARDGCFHPDHYYRKASVWPISFDDKYELTGYVLASLLETGLDYNSKPLLKAYNCLADNSKEFLEKIDSKPLSAIFYTYIQLLNGNRDSAMVWLKALEPLNNLDESDLLSGEMLSYLGLSYYLSNDLNSTKRFGEKLMNSLKLWRTPISCYAITKLWPILRHKTFTSMKVYGDNDQMLANIVLNETHSHHSISGHKVSIESDGCLIVAKHKVKTHLSTESTYFDIKIDGLDKGFVNCNRRRITVCIKEKEGLQTIHPVIRMQMITGFEVDTKLLKRMIDTEVVAKYKKRGSELMLFLHRFDVSRKSYCFTVPVVRRQELFDRNDAFIKIYDLYNEDLNDVIQYKLPFDCQIDQSLTKNKFQH